MKAFYNLVTFLAAVVVIGWAGFCVASHWDVLVSKAKGMKPACKVCCSHCTCGKTNCAGGVGGKKCCDSCGCTEKDCCKK